jgi:predicted MFS family arabinose efflux permease
MHRDLKLVAISLFTWALGEGLFLCLVTLRLEGLGATPVMIGNVMALYALAQAVVMIPAGLATDRWGAWQVMIGAWLVALLAVLLMALADALWLFAAGWLTYGLTSWMAPALTTYVTNRRGNLTPARALALVFASYTAGMILSPTLGGWIGQRFGLRAPFAAAVVFLLASTLAVAFARRDRPQPLGLAGRYDTLLHNRRFLLLMALSFVVMLALWLGIPLAPNFLQSRWDMSVAKIGLFGSAESVGGVILSLVLSRWSPQIALVALQMGGIIYLSTLLTTDQTPWLALAFFLRVGPLYGRQFIDALGIRLVPPSQRGLAFAASSTVQRMANVLAAMAAGWLYKFRPALPFQVALILVVLALLATWLSIPRITAEQRPVFPVPGEPLQA